MKTTIASLVAVLALCMLSALSFAQPPADAPPMAPPPPGGPAMGGPGAFGAGPLAPLMEADKDKDGNITKEEFLAAQEEVFKKLDTNSDGKLDKDEQATQRRAMMERLRGAAGARRGEEGAARGRGLRAMDTNNDGKISADEFKGQPERFKMLDKNSDGALSADELLPRAGGPKPDDKPAPAPEKEK